jgi:hypothetical protein
MANKFNKDSYIFKIPFLRALLSGNVDPAFKLKYDIKYNKTSQQPIFLAFMNDCLKLIVKIPPGGTWKDSIAGTLISTTAGPDNLMLYNELEKLCNLNFDKFISPLTDQSQCKMVGIVNKTSECTYNLDDTYPIINNNAVNKTSELWNNSTWCNNCWLCGLKVGDPKYPFTKQCEHILPYLTGSMLLGTATNTSLTLDINTKREYGQSHAICNMFKNQGEFIEFNPANDSFAPDYTQICNYIKELTGISIDKLNGNIINQTITDVASTKTIDSFAQVFMLRAPTYLSKGRLAQDMFNTITKVIGTLCRDSLNQQNVSRSITFIAKLLYSTILNFLVDSQVRAALIQSKGDTVSFRKILEDFYNRLSGQSASALTKEQVSDIIITYRSLYTADRIKERLKNYITNQNVPKPRKYMILAKSLYDRFFLKNSQNQFGVRRVARIASLNRGNSGKLRSIGKQGQSKKTLGEGIEMAVLGEEALLQKYYSLINEELFKKSLLYIVNALNDITYGNLYSSLTYQTSIDKYEWDNKFKFIGNKIILPRLVYNIYERIETLSQTGTLNVDMLRIVAEYFRDLSLPQLKIFSAYLYGMSIFSLLEYDLTNEVKNLTLYFGKKSNKLSNMSSQELKTKLKNVGINITKVTKSGKRLNLTRKEMEKKALLFKNLQLRAKKIGIKIMYKSKRRGYIYKSYTRLINELKQMKKSMKFG